MFDCVTGGGFSSRCKSRIKLIKSRLAVIKKRKSATVGYHKNDIAELLKNGLDINAFGRADGLISELNHLSCYELIEEFCGCILEKLSIMKKQRECPPETLEAVSSLMFAAARFADLPELRDLRRIFTDRYGNALKSSINREFTEKIESKPPSVEQKLLLLRNISREFSISWDFKALGKRISYPNASAGDQAKKYESLQNVKDDVISKNQAKKCDHLRNGKAEMVTKMNKDDAFTINEISTYKIREQTPTRQEMKTDNSKAIQPITKIKDDCKPSKQDIFGHRGSSVQSMRPHCTVLPPYVKTEGMDYGNNIKTDHRGSDHSESADLSIVDNNISRNKQGKTQVGSDHGISKNRQYKIKMGPDHSIHEKQLVRVVPRTKGSGDENDYYQDNYVGDAQDKLRSVRRKQQLKLLVQDNYTTSEDDESVSRNRRIHNVHGVRQGLRGILDDNHEEEVIMDELLMHYSKKPLTQKSSRAPTGLKTHHASDASKSLARRNKGDACLTDGVDHPQPNKEETCLNSDYGPPARVASLPPQPTGPTEMAKAPVRAASLEPNMLRPHVHPKLPDYDDLAARFAALKGERKQ